MESGHARPPRLAEVARLAGVSPGLVSRIINDDPDLRVRDETRETVLNAIKMLNYRPNAAARALRNSQTGLLGFALHDVHDPVYVEMVRAAQSEAAKHDHAIMLIDTLDLAQRRDDIRDIILSRRIDGMLIQSGFGGNQSEIQGLIQQIPTVVFNDGPIPGVRSIRADDTAASHLATEHLIESGHSEIAFLGTGNSTAVRRFDGYHNAITEAGLTPFAPIDVGMDSDSAHEAVMRLLRARPPLTALVASTMTTALGVHSAITASGLRLPEDMSLISLTDTWFARHLTPSLTAVSLPFAEIGAQAVTMLIDQIRKPSNGETVVTDPLPKVIERASVARIG